MQIQKEEHRSTLALTLCLKNNQLGSFQAEYSSEGDNVPPNYSRETKDFAAVQEGLALMVR